LCAALRWQANETQKTSGVEIVVRCPDVDTVVDRERALTLFRIFQESLTNVIRHAHATHVDVDLTETAVSYILRVSDNGVGIAAGASRKLTSHGIRGMRERALQLGGDVSLAPEEGGGTTLVATIPRAG
jgi:two-component system, NarL family, sensor histidine kinase UhpB